MSFPLLNNQVVEVVVVASADGQMIVNRFDYLIQVATGPGTSADLLTTFRTRFRDEILPRLTSNYRVVRYEVRRVIAAFVTALPPLRYGRVYDMQYDQLVGVPITDDGGVITAALPTFAAVTIRKITNLLGRQRRGSTRLAPIPEADTEAGGNLLLAASQTLWQSAADDFRLAIEWTGLFNDLALLSLFSAKDFVTGGGVLGTTHPFTYRVAEYKVNNYLGSQTSRKRSQFLD